MLIVVTLLSFFHEIKNIIKLKKYIYMYLDTLSWRKCVWQQSLTQMHLLHYLCKHIDEQSEIYFFAILEVEKTKNH
jgi:hypothetical protein